VDPRASLNDVEKREFLTVPGLELRPLDRPARGHSLNRLSCRYSVRINKNRAIKIIVCLRLSGLYRIK
jgi:hypothetical protein